MSEMIVYLETEYGRCELGRVDCNKPEDILAAIDAHRDMVDDLVWHGDHFAVCAGKTVPETVINRWTKSYTMGNGALSGKSPMPIEYAAGGKSRTIGLAKARAALQPRNGGKFDAKE